MKDILKKYKWYLIGFIVLFLIVIPAAINLLYKVPAPSCVFSTEWGAGDALAFYGVLVASIATIGGVYLSIQYSKDNSHDDLRNRVLPYLALTNMSVKWKFDPFLLGWEGEDEEEVSKEKAREYYEYKMDKAFFIIYPDRIEAKNSLTEYQQEIVESRGMVWVNSKKGSTLTKTEFISFPLEIENVGNGAAVQLRIGFNRKTEKHQYIKPIVLKQGQTFYLHIFAIISSDAILGDYDLEFYYKDIMGTKYCQKYPITFERDPEHGIMHVIDLRGVQHIDYERGD